MVRPAFAACVLVSALAASTHAQDPDTRLDALAASHADVARVELFGATSRGRPLRALVVAPGDLPLVERPGLLLVAGLDGRRLTDTDLLLALAEELLGQDDLEQALDGRALVFVPLANPDGAAALRGELGPRREVGGNRQPDDADRDGRTDEDGPSDLDGDGQVTWMRWPAGDGSWLIDEHDPRALRGPEDGERATHKVIREGLDDDGDGAWHEDGEEGTHVDRNFPHGFAEHRPTSGAYAASAPETRALLELLIDHPGLGGVVVIGADDTLVSLPSKAKNASSSRREPLNGLVDDDLATLKIVQGLLKEAGEHEVKGDGPSDGSLLAWAYHQGGRWPLGVKAWAAPETLPKADKPADDTEAVGDEGGEGDDAAEPVVVEGVEVTERPESTEVVEGVEVAESADDEALEAASESEDAADDDKPTSDKDAPVPAAVLAWLDEEHGGEGVVAWRPFDHPELGSVEIGGLAPGVIHAPPFSEVEGLVPTLAAFVRATLDAAPVLTFEDVKATDYGDGLVTVEATLVNTGALPTSPRFAADVGLTRPVRFRPRLPDGAVRAHGPEQVLVSRLGGHGDREELRWVLAGVEPGDVMTLEVDADCVADFELEVTLR